MFPIVDDVYAEPGSYTVTLAVTGPGGEATLVVPGAVSARALASATPRNGSGRNRVLYHNTGLPVLGGVWSAEVDASQHPGAGIVIVYGSNAPHPGVLAPAGELLIRFPAMGGVPLFRLAAASHGATAYFAVPIPADAALAGLRAYSQAQILGGGAEYCNAIDLVIGY